MLTNEQRVKNLRVPVGAVDLVLDTDAYNEIDDQFAIAYMLSYADRLRVQGIYAAPFKNRRAETPAIGMEKSYDEIQKLLCLADREDLCELTFRGAQQYLPDEKTPVLSDAVRHLTMLARRYSPERPLYVAAIGAVTNIASALLYAPEIADNIVVVWLGGNAYDFKSAHEFNMIQDIAAARVVFCSGAPVVQLPCMGVVSAFTTTRYELEHWLMGKNKLADYLVSATISEAERYAAGLAWSRVIWDVTAIAWLLNDGMRFMSYRNDYPCIPEHDGHISEERGEYPICYVNQIFRDALFTDLFKKLTKM